MSQQFTVHQYHTHAAPGDAITNQMLTIQSALAKVGIRGELFASEFNRALRGRVNPFPSRRVWNSDLLLIHHSFGNPNLRSLLKIEVPKGVVYHNITPAEYLSHDPHLERLSILGRKQLRVLRQKTSHAFSDSEYNGQELLDLGFKTVNRLPLFIKQKKTATYSTVKDLEKTTNLLFVGRVTSHKNQAGLVKAFYYFQSKVPDSKLVLVGGIDPIYGRYLRRLAETLGIESKVTLTGKVSNSELEQYYECSDLFLSLSQHEGFGIPLVEAMRHDLPVIAHINSGIAETLGEAGIHLHTLNPRTIAAVLIETLKSQPVLKQVLRSQQSQLSRIDTFQREANIQGPILDILQTQREQIKEQRSVASKQNH